MPQCRVWGDPGTRRGDDCDAGHGDGSALFTDGRLCPGLELGHHPWLKKTYEDYLGRRGLKKYGVKKWNKLLRKAVAQTSATFKLGPSLPGRRKHEAGDAAVPAERHDCFESGGAVGRGGAVADED